MHSRKVKYHIGDKYIVYPKMAWEYGIGRLSKITFSRERLFLIALINSGEHVDSDMYFIVWRMAGELNITSTVLCGYIQ